MVKAVVPCTYLAIAVTRADRGAYAYSSKLASALFRRPLTVNILLRPTAR